LLRKFGTDLGLRGMHGNLLASCGLMRFLFLPGMQRIALNRPK
jgi:hypothetical protein